MSIFTDMQADALEHLRSVSGESVDYVPYPSGTEIEGITAIVGVEHTKVRVKQSQGDVRVRARHFTLYLSDVADPQILAAIRYGGEQWRICEIVSRDTQRAIVEAEITLQLDSSPGAKRPNLPGR